MSEQKLLKLSTDFVFKRIFATNTDVLADLLNAVLDLPPGEKIASLRVLNPEITKDCGQGKTAFLDIHATDEKNVHFIVEMQAFPQKGFIKRALFYWAQAFAQGLKQGDSYINLTKVYSVNFVDFDLIPESKNYLSQFLLLNTEDPNFQMTDLLDFTFVEIVKFPRQKCPHELTNDLDTWIYLFAHCQDLTEEDVRTIIDKNPKTEMVVTQLKELSADEKTKMEYDAHIRWQLSHNIELAEARKEGLQEGKQEGLQEGKQQGAQDAKVEIALGMLSNKADDEFILRVTKISAAQLAELKQQLRVPNDTQRK